MSHLFRPEGEDVVSRSNPHTNTVCEGTALDLSCPLRLRKVGKAGGDASPEVRHFISSIVE